MNEQRKEYKKKFKIVIVSIVIFLLIAAAHFGSLCRKYPQIRLSQEEFYGADNQNLNDFYVEDGRLVSWSADPWITCILEDVVDVKVIELNMEGIEKKGLYGEIFDMKTWQSKIFGVHNGRILVFYTDEEGTGIKNLRFDLVAEQGISLNVNSVVLNSRYGLLYNTAVRFGPLLLCMLLIEAMMFVLYGFERNANAGKREKIVLGVWMALQLLIAGITFGIVTFRDVTDLELTWLWIVCLAEILLTFLTILKRKTPTAKSGIKFLGAAETICFVIVSFGQLEITSGITYDFQKLVGGLWNILLLWFGISVLCMFFRRKKIAFVVLNVVVAALSIANHYFYQFRGKPLELSDLLLAETALTVIGNYTFQIDAMLFFFFIIELGVIFYFLVLDGKRKMSGRMQQASCVGVFLIFLGIVTYTPEVSYWNMVYSTQECGYLNAFVAYAKNDMKHNRPEHYSAKQVQEILGQYGGETQADEPVNIIVIMDEAFSDLPVTYGFETDVDGMPFIHSLEENTVKGNMLVSVFGGSTADTEYEFLTGNTMAFINGGNVPYMQYVKRQQASLASKLKELGYQTVAFHPCEAGNYNRDKVYPFMGFDQFISAENELKYDESLRWYMSDDADFMNVIDIYENRQADQPFFLFNVTMQNHGGYSTNESAVEVTVKPQKEELQYTQLLEYLSLVKKTDEAFEKLVTYFSNADEKTIILMFGDHQPGLDVEIYKALDENLYEEDITMEQMEQMYMVPFVMWANYEIESENGVLTSPGYLRAMLLEKAGMPMSRYDQFLLQCQEMYPAINIIGYYDEEGILKNLEDISEDELMIQYRMLQYANMFDKKLRGEF